MADEKDNAQAAGDGYEEAVPALAVEPEAKIVVAGDHELSRTSHRRRLAIATAALALPRREIPNLLAATYYEFRGEIVWGSGVPFVITDTTIDDAFNNDGSFRWLSDFVQFAEVEPKQRPQRRVLSRLRLIDLYFRIAHPERAKWIAA
jgi:hypothetical protein